MDRPREFFPSPEKEKLPEPSIRLEFFRHDEKTKPATAGKKIDDRSVRLTERGRQQATEKGKGKLPEAEVSIAYGSPRERSIETAYRQMLSNQEEITAEMSLEDIREEVDKHLKVGKKEKITSKLDFNFSGTSEFQRQAYDHYLKTKDVLVFLFEDSDNLVMELGDRKSTSYSRIAANIAELIKKHVKMLPRWEVIAKEKPEKYKIFKNEMQRYFGSHQGVPECFLIKAIEKISGREDAAKFIESLSDKNGFGHSEGYTLVISASDDSEPNLLLRYEEQEWKISPEVLDEIIKDAQTLDEQVVANFQ